MSKRKQHQPEFKAKDALSGLESRLTTLDYHLRPMQDVTSQTWLIVPLT
jgi:hypothetical protein